MDVRYNLQPRYMINVFNTDSQVNMFVFDLLGHIYSLQQNLHRNEERL